MREGMSTMIPVPLLSLMTAQNLEQCVCGMEDIDIMMLKKVVRYRSPTRCMYLDVFILVHVIEGRGFMGSSLTQGSNFSLKITASGFDLCCFAYLSQVCECMTGSNHGPF